MGKNAIYSQEEIIKIANEVIGKTFGELNDYIIDDSDYNKGSHGHIIEQDAYHYDINSSSQPDFLEAGIELKVTPYKKNKNGTLSAKERLVLNIINYMEEYKNTFYTSHFWHKNKKLEIIWYLDESGKKNKKDFVITNSLLFEFSKNDLPIIIQDWNAIINKIKQGKAHEISEADTMYLGACTKGKNSQTVREQPFSNIKAKQRAFCLKTSYMTQLVRKYIKGDISEQIIESLPCNKTFEEILEERISKYKGMSIYELCSLFNINSKSKNINEILMNKMFGIKGKISKTDEFQKANITAKTIRINSKGKIKESMSFPAFKFEEIINENWEDFNLKELFETTKFMFMVFKEYDGNYLFENIKFWNMPNEIIEKELKTVWERTKEVVRKGNIVKEIKNGKRYTNFPHESENKYCHVRPHGQNADDTYPLPVADKLTGEKKYTKHCFWLNNSYILKILKDK